MELLKCFERPGLAFAGIWSLNLSFFLLGLSQDFKSFLFRGQMNPTNSARKILALMFVCVTTVQCVLGCSMTVDLHGKVVAAR